MSKESKDENPGAGSKEERTGYLYAASEISALKAMLSMKKNDECNSEKMTRKKNEEEK